MAGQTFKIPLKSIFIGNPWIDPMNEFSEYGLFAESLGLVN